MKKLALVTCALVLVGCQSPLDDVINNQYSATVPQSPPVEVQNTWSGSIGPYLATIVMDDTGMGLYCYTSGDVNILEKIKYNDGKFYFQHGPKSEVTVEGENLKIISNYYGSSTVALMEKDPLLQEASIYCEDKLKQI